MSAAARLGGPEALLDRIRSRLEPVDGPARPPAFGDGDLDAAAHRNGAGEGLSKKPLRPAAVLALLQPGETGLEIVFTRRADHLQAHAGQISFPGGRQNVGRESLAETALRETEEEIGVPAGDVTLLGRFDAYRTVTGFAVTPFVGHVTRRPAFRPDPGEVAEVFSAPFDFLMNPRNHRLAAREFRGVLRRFYAMPYQGRYIWGATAGMLKALSDRLNP